MSPNTRYARPTQSQVDALLVEARRMRAEAIAGLVRGMVARLGVATAARPLAA
ncbi:RSP_7527 family protein [Limimaricola variabilis]